MKLKTCNTIFVHDNEFQIIFSLVTHFLKFIQFTFDEKCEFFKLTILESRNEHLKIETFES